MIKSFTLWFLLLCNFPMGNVHDLFMSICEIEEKGGKLELSFYLFHDDLKTALYDNPAALEIKEEDAVKYFSEKTELSLGGQIIPLELQDLEYRKEQVRLVFRAPLLQNQKIENIKLKSRLLLEYFPTQVNMVYFIKKDGERLVEMLDADETEAVFEL